MFLCSLASTSLALLVSAICKTTDLSVMVLPLALEITRLFGGFFLSPSRLPKYFSWLDALSYVKYTFVGTSLNELHGLNLTCTATDISQGKCYTTGEQLIKEWGFDYISIGGCVGALIAYIVGCRFIAYLGVRYLKHWTTHSATLHTFLPMLLLISYLLITCFCSSRKNSVCTWLFDCTLVFGFTIETSSWHYFQLEVDILSKRLRFFRVSDFLCKEAMHSLLKVPIDLRFDQRPVIRKQIWTRVYWTL